MTARRDAGSNIFWHCHDCDKQAYPTRRAARARTARFAPGDHLRAYKCPTTDAWHLGHLASGILRGAVSARDVYGPPHREFT